MQELDRRLYKRFSAPQPIELVAPNGKTFEGRSINISLAGMEVRCDRWTLSQLIPPNERQPNGQPPELKARFELPVFPNKSPVEIRARCRVLAMRRLSEEEYQINLNYVFFDGTGYHDLEKFIDQRGP